MANGQTSTGIEPAPQTLNVECESPREEGLSVSFNSGLARSGVVISPPASRHELLNMPSRFLRR